MENTDTALATVATISNSQPGTSICSIKPDPGDAELAKTVYNAMNNPTHKLSDFVNKKINVANYLIEVAEIADEDTGEILKTPRTVLISPDGESFMATSKGVYKSIRNAVAVLGDAPWNGGVVFEVKQQKVGRGNMLTLMMV